MGTGNCLMRDIRMSRDLGLGKPQLVMNRLSALYEFFEFGEL